MTHILSIGTVRKCQQKLVLLGGLFLKSSRSSVAPMFIKQTITIDCVADTANLSIDALCPPMVFAATQTDKSSIKSQNFCTTLELKQYRCHTEIALPLPYFDSSHFFPNPNC